MFHFVFHDSMFCIGSAVPPCHRYFAWRRLVQLLPQRKWCLPQIGDPCHPICQYIALGIEYCWTITDHLPKIKKGAKLIRMLLFRISFLFWICLCVTSYCICGILELGPLITLYLQHFWAGTSQCTWCLQHLRDNTSHGTWYWQHFSLTHFNLYGTCNM